MNSHSEVAARIIHFQSVSGYIVDGRQRDAGQNSIMIGHTADVTPWSDGDTHLHTNSDEFYILLKGTLRFIVGKHTLTLRQQELLCVRAGVPHAVLDGSGVIEHFGLRAPALNDKEVVTTVSEHDLGLHPEEDVRELHKEWGSRVSLESIRNQNCWLLGTGSAHVRTEQLCFAYMNYTTDRKANVGIGSRHRLHHHRDSWEYYVVLEGQLILRVDKELVEVRPGEMLAVPPGVNHVLCRRETPFQSFTIRAPLLDDKVEVGD